MFLYFERNLREILPLPGEPFVHAVGTAVRETWGNDGDLIGLVFGIEEFEREQVRSHGSTFGDSCGKFHRVPFYVCDCRYALHDPSVHHGVFLYEDRKRKMIQGLPPLRSITERHARKEFIASRIHYHNGNLTIEPIEAERLYHQPQPKTRDNPFGMSAAELDYIRRPPTPPQPKRPPSKLHPLVQLDEQLRALAHNPQEES